MAIGCLVDITRCIGCRSCQVACKQSHGLEGDKTRFFAARGGYQNPSRFSPLTYTLVTFHESSDNEGHPAWAFVKRQCMHCTELYCGAVCAQEVFSRNDQGVVVAAGRCMGCAACVEACPFEVPVVDYWDVATPHLRKCTLCTDRREKQAAARSTDSLLLLDEAEQDRKANQPKPACAKACPSGAIQFGERDNLLAEARRRISAAPEKYLDHIYGESEAGGTSWLYISHVPFDKLGFPTRFQPPLEMHRMEMGAVGPEKRRWLGWLGSTAGVLVAGFTWLVRRRNELAERD